MEGSAVSLWVIRISAQLPLMRTLEAYLDNDELERALKFHKADDRNRFVTGRAILRILLGRHLKMDAGKIIFKYGQNEKPELANDGTDPIYFNVSHSGDLVLIAMSEQEVGVDVEWINPDFDFKDILPEYFSEQEILYILEANSQDRFFECWTKKEAALKAEGLGLVGNGSSASLHLQLNSFKLNGAYWACVASQYESMRCHFYNSAIDL